MTRLRRLLMFNLVGAAGAMVQLAALAVLNRLLHGRYLLASGAALEITLLHNFVWHTRYTWRDRREGSSRSQQLVRFHLSNGLLSLAGNITLMRLLVDVAHQPVLVANAVAILCCSGMNFWFSHRWAFSAPRSRQKEAQPVLHPVLAPILAPQFPARVPSEAARHGPIRRRSTIDAAP